MNPQLEKKTINSSEYVPMVNYLIETLNKSKSANIHQALHNKPIFLYEFFVFDLYVPSEILRKIKQPVLAFRFLDFPTLTLQGTVVHPKKLIQFNQGKSSYFEMEIGELKEALTMNAMYIMLIDMNYGDMSIIASSRLNISIFAYDSFIEYENGKVPKPRRNILKLFDNVLEKIAEFEMSLLIRREYYKYEQDAFPYNEKKIFIQENSKVNSGFNNKNSTYARPVSNDLRMRSTDDIIQSQIEVNHKENINQGEVNNELGLRKNIKNASVNTAGYVPCLNNNIEDRDSNALRSKKSVAFSQINPSPTQYPSRDQNNQFTNEVFDLKKMLNSNEKNPPPLYFHNTKQNPMQNHSNNQQSQETIIRVIHEEYKTNQMQEEEPINNANTITKSSQLQNNVSINQNTNNTKASVKKKKQFHLVAKKKDKELIEEMYQKSKKRYDDYITNNSISLSSSQKNKKSKTKRLQSTNNKIEEKEKESDEDEEYNDFVNSNINQASDEKNEYLKLFSQIKSNVRGERPTSSVINKSSSLKKEEDSNANVRDNSTNDNKKQSKKKEIDEDTSNYYNEKEFNNVINSGIVSSGNIMQSFQQSNDIPFESGLINSSSKKMESNLNIALSRDNEKGQGKVKNIEKPITSSPIKESMTSKYSSSINQSIFESSIINKNNQKPIEEENKKQSDNQTDTNKSQIITDENMIKKKSTPSHMDSSAKIQDSSLVVNNHYTNQDKDKHGHKTTTSIQEDSMIKQYADEPLEKKQNNQSSIKEDDTLIKNKKNSTKSLKESDNQKSSIIVISSSDIKNENNNEDVSESIAQISESHPEYKFSSISQQKITSYGKLRNSNDIEEILDQ